MKKISLALMLAGSLLASEYSYEISPMIGGVKPEGNLDIDSQKAFGARFQMNDFDVLGLVPELSFDRTTTTDYEYNAGSTTINRYAFNGLYDFEDVSETITPYVLIGLGYEDVRDEKLGYDNSVYGNYGAGLKMKIYEDIALRAELKHLIRTDDGGNELYYGVGLSIPFGEKGSAATEEAAEEPKEEVVAVVVEEKDSDNDGVNDTNDKCSTTPKGVKVDANGCALDSDNDGVADYLDKCSQSAQGIKVDANGCELDSDKDGVVDSADKCSSTVSGVKVDANGCAQSIVLDIVFENASANINAAYSPKLQEYITFMNENPAYNTTIVGHTDSRGAESFNQQLSQKRADSVRAALIEGGVEGSRIAAVGKGEAEPIADNASAEGRAKNRRIEAQLKLRD